jgi:hypothetical protein
MSDTLKVREEAINSALAELLSAKVGEWLTVALGESVIKTPPKMKLPDIYFVEYYGMKIAFEARIGLGNIRSAVKKCQDRVKEGIADVCFAVTYDEGVANIERIEEVKKKLLASPLRLVIVSATSLDGIDLGEVKIEELVSMLEKHRIYDLLVSKEIALEMASRLKGTLDGVAQLPLDVLNGIATLAERELKLIKKPSTEEEEGEEEE